VLSSSAFDENGDELLVSVTGEAEAGSAGEQPLETHSDDTGSRPQPTGSENPADTDPGWQTIWVDLPIPQKPSRLLCCDRRVSIQPRPPTDGA
jgi:hypothetical protein